VGGTLPGSSEASHDRHDRSRDANDPPLPFKPTHSPSAPINSCPCGGGSGPLSPGPPHLAGARGPCPASRINNEARSRSIAKGGSSLQRNVGTTVNPIARVGSGGRGGSPCVCAQTREARARKQGSCKEVATASELWTPPTDGQTGRSLHGPSLPPPTPYLQLSNNRDDPRIRRTTSWASGARNSINRASGAFQSCHGSNNTPNSCPQQWIASPRRGLSGLIDMDPASVSSHRTMPFSCPI